jgi:signal recognition particle GTPase
VARQALTGLDTPLASPVAAQAVNLGASTTLDAVLADTAGLAHLQVQRTGVLDNVKVRLALDAELVKLPSTLPNLTEGGR